MYKNVEIKYKFLIEKGDSTDLNRDIIFNITAISNETSIIDAANMAGIELEGNLHEKISIKYPNNTDTLRAYNKLPVEIEGNRFMWENLKNMEDIYLDILIIKICGA